MSLRCRDPSQCRRLGPGPTNPLLTSPAIGSARRANRGPGLSLSTQGKEGRHSDKTSGWRAQNGWVAAQLPEATKRQEGVVAEKTPCSDSGYVMMPIELGQARYLIRTWNPWTLHRL